MLSLGKESFPLGQVLGVRGGSHKKRKPDVPTVGGGYDEIHKPL